MQIAAELGVGGIVVFAVLIKEALKAAWGRRRALTEIARINPEAVSLDLALTTASLISLIGLLTAIAFLSMAYDAMTMFALTVPVAMALGGPPLGLPGAKGRSSMRRRTVTVRRPSSGAVTVQ